MLESNPAIRAGAALLSIASLLLIAALIIHGPLAPNLGEQMTDVTGRAFVWAAIHWVSAASLSLFAMASLIVLTARSRLTNTGLTVTAWALLTVSALWTITTAVSEATVVTDAALAGNREMFEAWWAFAEGKASGVAFLALSVAVIAGNEARSAERVVPAWSSRVATVAGVASFAGWALGRWLGVDLGNLLWVASSVFMSGWLAWFGVALMRVRPANSAVGKQ